MTDADGQQTDPQQVAQPSRAPDDRGLWRNVIGQLQRNSVAYISLFIAITGLLYNTWRNETSEYQRNIRSASFFAIEHVANFQSLVNNIVYSDGCQQDHSIDAWGHIKALETLAGVLPESSMHEISQLGVLWTQHSGELCSCSDLTGERLSQCVAASDARHRQIDQDILYPQVKKVETAIVDLVKGLD